MDHPVHHPEQQAIEVPPAKPVEDFGPCEFCLDPATVRVPVKKKSGFESGLFVYGCAAHRENAERVARARIKA